MSDCCVKSVPQSDSSYETFGQPVMDWMARLTAGLNRSIPNPNQTMGDLERQILQQTQGVERKLLEEASQKKADQSPPVCHGRKALAHFRSSVSNCSSSSGETARRGSAINGLLIWRSDGLELHCVEIVQKCFADQLAASVQTRGPKLSVAGPHQTIPVEVRPFPFRILPFEQRMAIREIMVWDYCRLLEPNSFQTFSDN